MVPGKKPVGPVEVDWSHDIPNKYQLLSFWLFRGSDSYTGGNTSAEDFYVYDAAQGKRVNIQSAYSVHYGRGFNKNGPTLYNTTGNVSPWIGWPHTGTACHSAYGWKPIVANQEYTTLMSFEISSTSGAPKFIDGNGARIININAISYSSTAQTIRFINEAAWSASYDESFTETLVVGEDLFMGMSFNGASNKRIAYFGNSTAERTTFTGSLTERVGIYKMMAHGLSDRLEYFMMFAKELPKDLAAEIKRDPYQFLKPAGS